MKLILLVTLLAACVLYAQGDGCCSEWNNWGRCYNCVQFRTRNCNRSGYKPCSYGESYKESRSCGGPCPEPCDCKTCDYGGWGQWSACSCSEDPPTRTRHRNCPKCPHCKKVGSQLCRLAVWAKWGTWSGCDCDHREQVRKRVCREKLDRCLCKDYHNRQQSRPCPKLPQSYWNKWGPWSNCPTCPKKGYEPRSLKRMRTRTCTVQCGVTCDGDDTEQETCPDPPQSQWLDWTEWSPCQKCKNHKSTRARKCEKYCDIPCEGISYDERECPKPPVSIWGKWSQWTRCDRCQTEPGAYFSTRSRKCFQECGKACYGADEEKQACPEPPPSNWLPWSDWTVCKKCKYDKSTRKRRCYAPCDVPCPGKSYEEEYCPVPPVSYWSEWGQWSKCDTCYPTGKPVKLWKTRSRICNVECAKPCRGSDTERMRCPDPKISTWGPWTSWTLCDICKGGSSTRERKCDKYCDIPCRGKSKEEHKCPPPPESYWTEWSDWTKCPQCKPAGQRGPSYKTRTRMCVEKCGKKCSGPPEERMRCPDPPPSKWEPWTHWTICDPCKGGKSTRERRCDVICEPCRGQALQERNCPKPEVSTWNKWTPWSLCPTCPGYDNYIPGSMYQTRTRNCMEKCHKECVGESEQKRQCPDPPPSSWWEWGRWAACDMCKGGTTTRERSCEEECGIPCSGPSTETMQCPLPPNSFWGSWGPWSKCPECSPGYKSGILYQTRTRECKGKCKHARPCIGPSTDKRKCPDPKKSYWSAWGAWSECKECEGGNKYRTRTCVKKCGVSCPGNPNEEKPCHKPPESYWDKWSAWSECPCGGGYKKRTRVCHVKCKKKCDGPAKEEMKCVNPLQPCKCKWSVWSPCQYANSYCNSCECGETERWYRCSPAHYCPQMPCPPPTFEKGDCCGKGLSNPRG